MSSLTAEREMLLLVGQVCRKLLAAGPAEGGPPAIAVRLADLEREIRASTTVVVEFDGDSPVRAQTGP